MSKRVLVGNVLFEEALKIKYLHKRRGALLDLKPTVDELTEELKQELYPKIESEIKEVDEDISDWWKQQTNKYNWPKGITFYIEFDTGKVFQEI